MAESWYKMNTDMFNHPKIRYLRRLPEGNNIVLIWIMLLGMARRCNSSGNIFLTENVPYTPQMLAYELDFEESTVQLALSALEQLSMISRANGYILIVGWGEHQNAESLDKIREQNRIRQARYKANQKALPGNVTDNVTVTLNNALDKEKEEEIDIENKKENKSVRETTHTLFDRLIPDYDIPSSVSDKMGEWIKYKTERKEPYKEQGMKTLLRQIENNCMKYGDRAICDLIDDSMANGWKGIIFDRLKQARPQQKPQVQPRRNGNVFLDMLGDDDL